MFCQIATIITPCSHQVKPKKALRETDLAGSAPLSALFGTFEEGQGAGPRDLNDADSAQSVQKDLSWTCPLFWHP